MSWKGKYTIKYKTRDEDGKAVIRTFEKVTENPEDAVSYLINSSYCIDIISVHENGKDITKEYFED